MKKLFTIILAVSATVATVSGQYARNSYFMDASPLRNNMNPALIPDCEYVNIPVLGSLGFGYNSNTFAVSDIFYKADNGKIISFLNPEIPGSRLYGILNPMNGVDFDFRTDILGGGFYAAEGFWTVGVETRVQGGVNLPRDLFRFYKEMSGTNDLSGLGVNATVSANVNVGYAIEVIPDLTVGARVRFIALAGEVNAHFDRLQLNVNRDEISVAAQGEVTVSGLNLDLPELDGDDDYLSLGDFFSFAKNPVHFSGFNGLSFDIGAEYVLPWYDITVSASVLDMGFMSWTESAVTRGLAQANYTFTGFDLNDENQEDDFGNFSEIFQFDLAGSKKVSKTLRPTFIVGAQMPFLDDLLRAGFVYTNKKTQYVTKSELTAMVSVHPVSWFSGSLSYTFVNPQRVGKSAYNCFGLAINFHPKWINFFIGTDFMISRINQNFIPLDQKRISFYGGISVPIGRKPSVYNGDLIL